MKAGASPTVLVHPQHAYDVVSVLALDHGSGSRASAVLMPIIGRRGAKNTSSTKKIKHSREGEGCTWSCRCRSPRSGLSGDDVTRLEADGITIVTRKTPFRPRSRSASFLHWDGTRYAGWQLHEIGSWSFLRSCLPSSKSLLPAMKRRNVVSKIREEFSSFGG